MRDTLGEGIAAPATGAPRVGVDDVEHFARELFASTRTLPVVAVTTSARTGELTLDADWLAEELAGRATVVVIETGEATWALSDALPERLDVFGGAARIWWPGLTAESDPFDHPLIFVKGNDPRVVEDRIVDAVHGVDERARRYHGWHEPRPAAEGTRPDLAQVATPATAPVAAPPPPRGVTKSGRPILAARVTGVDGPRISLEAGALRGTLHFADEKLADLGARLRVGDEVPVFVAAEGPEGIRFSTQGLLPRPASPPPVADGVRTGALTKTGRPVLRATVTEISGARIVLQAGDLRGTLHFADEKLADLAARLQVGDEVPAFVAAEGPEGLRFSTQGLLAKPGASAPPSVAAPVVYEVAHDGRTEAPQRPQWSHRPERRDPWHVVDEEYRVGDVVRGRVCAIRDKFVLIELLPGAAVLCPIGELSSDFVQHPEDVVSIGDRVNVELLELDPAARRGLASLRSAGWAEPRPAISPGPGLPPFLDDPPDAAARDDEAARLLVELESVNADRAELRKRLKATREQVIALRKELRSLEERYRSLETSHEESDPISSETAFLAAVRVEYARRVSESDRIEYPLLRMRVGREFLARVRQLEGIDIAKIVEVCAQVASGRAHLVSGREVHELRTGEGGAPARLRERDQAKAWRCALQVNTPSARRLHWWEVPGKHPRLADGRIIEFASVAVHDDFSIP